jgi:hypothetical protein
MSSECKKYRKEKNLFGILLFNDSSTSSRFAVSDFGELLVEVGKSRLERLAFAEVEGLD